MNLYGTAMFRMCIIYLNDVTLAEAAMQDTFLKAYRRMDSLEIMKAGSEKAWMMCFAIKACRHYRRVGWLRHIGRHNDLKGSNIVLSEMAEQKRVLLKAIMALPAKQKEVVLLSHYQDMIVEDAGKSLHLSQSAVKFRLKTAMKKIRSKLERWYFDE